MKKNNQVDEGKTPTEKARVNFRRFSVGKLFFGLLLILVGFLALAESLGFVQVYWVGMLQLWPLLLVVSGLAMLSYNNRYWKVLSAIAVVAMLVVVAVVSLGVIRPSVPMAISEVAIQKVSSEVKQIDITVKAGAGSINIDGMDQDDVVRADLSSNFATLWHQTSVVDTTQSVEISMDSRMMHEWLLGGVRSNLNLTLQKGLPLQLNIESGAADMNIDLSEVQARQINIKTGVSSLDLVIGANEDAVDVNVSSGVSSIQIDVPQDSGVNLQIDGGLNSKSISGLIKVKDNIYQTAGFDDADRKINIAAAIGLSSFSVNSY
jgi:hypothetical protein